MYIATSMKSIKIFLLLISFAWIANAQTTIPSFSQKGMGSLEYGRIGKTNTTSLEPIQLEQEADSQYIVGPGDYFDLYMENNSATVQVSPDGMVGLEQLGVVRVAGLNLPQAIIALQELLAKKFSGKESFAKLSKLKSFRIGIYGAVLESGQHDVNGGTRLSYLLRKIGGVQGTANADSILLIRDGDTTVVHFFTAEQSGSRSHDPYLKQGDLIVVPDYPQTTKVVLVRINGQGRTLPWVEGMTADRYLQRSELLRGNKLAFTHLNIQDAKTSKSRRILMTEISQFMPDAGQVLEPVGDGGLVHIGGAIARMGSLPYNPSWTPHEYVANSGLTYASASYGNIRVIHKDGREEWMDPAKGVIEPGDYIEIPRSSYEETKDVTLFLASIISVLSTAILVYVTWQSSKK